MSRHCTVLHNLFLSAAAVPVLLLLLPFRYEKRHTNISAHISPCFRCREGDTVVIGQCRYETEGAGGAERGDGTKVCREGRREGREREEVQDRQPAADKMAAAAMRG